MPSPLWLWAPLCRVLMRRSGTFFLSCLRQFSCYYLVLIFFSAFKRVVLKYTFDPSKNTCGIGCGWLGILGQPTFTFSTRNCVKCFVWG